MIVLVTGLAGSGKTDTCYTLLAQNYFTRAVFIESDWFGAKIPFDWTDKNDIESIYQEIGLLVDYNLKKGIEHFIITFCIPLLRQHHNFIKHLNKSMPIVLFCLTCEKDEVIKRIHGRGRNREQKQYELDAIDSDFAYLNDFISQNNFAKEINNTRMTEEEVASQIIKIIK